MHFKAMEVENELPLAFRPCSFVPFPVITLSPINHNPSMNTVVSWKNAIRKESPSTSSKKITKQTDPD